MQYNSLYDQLKKKKKPIGEWSGYQGYAPLSEDYSQAQPATQPVQFTPQSPQPVQQGALISALQRGGAPQTPMIAPNLSTPEGLNAYANTLYTMFANAYPERPPQEISGIVMSRLLKAGMGSAFPNVPITFNQREVR